MSSMKNESASVADNNSFWSILREAIHGSSRDFTTGSIGLAIFLLAVPMILEMLMESIFVIVDIYFVGHLGAEAVSIVVLTESILALVYALAIGLSIGAGATVARRTGEKDELGARKSATHAIYATFGISIVMAVPGVIFAPEILRGLGGSPAVVEHGTTFMQLMLGGNAVIIFIFVLNSILRGAGDAAVAMRVLMLANGLNILLAPAFVYGPDIFGFLGINAPTWIVENWPFPKLGVTGAAVGTTIGRGVGALFALWQLFQPNGRITIKRDAWVFEAPFLRTFLNVAAPAILQFTIATLSWSVLVSIVARFGDDALAGYGVGMRVVIFALMPAFGLSNAAATLVGQSLGAADPARAESAVWKAAVINAVVLGLTGVAFLVFADPIIRTFTDEPNVIAYGKDTLRIIAYGFSLYGFGMVVESAFNGAGDTWTPTVINIFVFWLFEIPLAFVLANYFGMGMHGVLWAITISFSVLAVVSTIVFKRGKWKEKKV